MLPGFDIVATCTINSMAKLRPSLVEIGGYDADSVKLREFAARLGKLLDSTRANQVDFVDCADDFLGALYGLAFAKRGGYVDRTDKPKEFAAVKKRARELSLGAVRTHGPWMAGFHFNSALFRLAASYHRFLKLVTGKSNGYVPDLEPCAKALYKKRTGSEWQNFSLNKIHDQVNHLKHAPDGTYLRRKVLLCQAMSAVQELLDLVEHCT